ncbi:MAG: AI-2E family transporter [Anaerolineae bacterium]
MLDTWRAWDGRQRARAALTAAVTALVLLFLYAARGALAPFILGLGAAYLVWPAVQWLQRRMPGRIRGGGLGRVLAIAVVYLVGLALFAGFFAYLVPIIIGQIEQLVANREVIFRTIQGAAASVQHWYLDTVPPEVRALLDTRLRNMTDQIAATIGQGIAGSVTVVSNVVAVVLGYLMIPIWVGFVLYDAERLECTLGRLVPESWRADASNLVLLMGDILGGYVRGQIVLAALTGLLTILALSLVGVQFAVLLGFLAGIFDLIPTLGPILIAIPTFLIGAADRPTKGLWALVALIAVQQFESLVLAPRIVGRAVQIRPALIILLLVIGSELFGFWGLLIIVPLAALLRDVIAYLYIRTDPGGVSPEQALARVRGTRATVSLRTTPPS